jgi:hypothetical protein
MKQHKWHKEIKAWADGAEIEMWYGDRWEKVYSVIEWDKDYEYRIKPQPIITDYYIWANHKGEVRFCHPDKLCETPIEYHYIGKLTLKDER